MNKKIQTIANLIKPCDIVIDVGCDHCLLALNLLQTKKAKLIVNIDKNFAPLAAGIDNLDKYNLTNQTINLVNDGLNNLKMDNKIFHNFINIDYCVIAGIGGNKIIDILKKTQLAIAKFIMHPTKNEYQLRTYLTNNFFKIEKEYYIFDRGFYYLILLVKRVNKKIQYSKEELYFGKINNVTNKKIYNEMLQKRLFFLKTMIEKNQSSKNKLSEEYTLLKKRIKLNENK